MLKITLKMSAAVAVLMTTGAMAKSENTSSKSVLTTYADIALANYNDALNDAKALQKAIEAFTKSPTNKTMNAAKNAWLQARESYGQTEAFRLANGPIDAEKGWVSDAYGALEGQLNAWPLDENMIDYTIDANGKRTSGNIIDTKGSFNPGGEESKAIDVATITIEAITALNENGGDANVATGYHAIEFLLWGQDQDYASFVKDSITHGATVAGQRPLTDYTTDANAQRRKAYLNAASQKIVSDLATINSAWNTSISADCSKDATGCYRGAILSLLKGNDAKKNITPNDALKDILAGLGVFIKSEVANERIAVAVLTPSEEDEHSCFSDNTHRDITTNYQGFKNILLGTYNGVDYGKAPIDALNADAKEEILSLMKKIETKIASINAIAETSRHFDRQILSDDSQSRVIVKLKNELRKLGDMMVAVSKANGINLSIEDVTDADETKI